MEDKKLFAETVSNSRLVVEFVNSKGLKKEDIITISVRPDGTFTIFYFE